MTEAIANEQSSSHEAPLVKRLIELAKKEDRAALAALRSGAGKRPGSAPRMLRILAPYLRSDEGPWVEAAFLTAALFAGHSHHADVGTLGVSLRLAVRDRHREPGVEARFVAALDAHPEDLARHLAGLVSLCESAGVPIDWHRFYWDTGTLLSDDEDRRIRTRTRWARDFWRGATSDQDENDTTEEKEE